MSVALNALTTLTVALDELDLTTDGGTQDTRVERYIDTASADIARYCNRAFQRENDIAEDVPGFGTAFLLVSRKPILAIDSVTFDGDTVDSDSYEIYDALAGMIYSTGGWLWTTAVREDITRPPLPGYERKLYQVTYNGGFITRAQIDTGGTYVVSSVAISRVGTTATVVDTAHGLVTEDRVLIAGATETEYNGTFAITVVDEDTYTYTVPGTPATPATGSPTSTPRTTLPNDLEDACLQLVNSRWSQRGHDPRIASEKSLSYSVAYTKDEMPASVVAILDSYKRFVQA